jgi:hypothetical protein
MGAIFGQPKRPGVSGFYKALPVNKYDWLNEGDVYIGCQVAFDSNG